MQPLLLRLVSFRKSQSSGCADYKARENFIGMDSMANGPQVGQPVPRAFMGIIDTATGEGTLHCQTKEQQGRKCKIVILSRFVALSVSLIQNASLFQTGRGATTPAI